VIVYVLIDNLTGVSATRVRRTILITAGDLVLQAAIIVLGLALAFHPDHLTQSVNLWSAPKASDLAFALDKITVQPNTLDAHRLSGCAEKIGRQNEMVEALLKAFFMQGISLNDHEALTDLAATVGLDWAQVSMYLASKTDVQAVEQLEQEVRNAGIDIVPFYIFNGKVTVAGAHEVMVLLEAMEMATKAETASVVE